MSSSSMPWVKVYTEILDDPKVGNLSESAQLRYIQLIVVAGECDAEGALVKGDSPLTIDEIARRLRVRRDKLAKELDQILEQSLIYLKDNCYFVHRFSERQGRSQSEKREYWKLKQRESRAKAENVNVDSTLTQGDVNAQRERREEREKRREEVTAQAPDPPYPLPTGLPAVRSLFQALERTSELESPRSPLRCDCRSYFE